jgi:[CysO sulfur-carrier protein]-S-L-cysteine hydrolase
VSTPFRLLIPRTIYEDIVAQAVQELPNECCGLLAGRIVPELPDRTVIERFPLVNADASPREYTSDAKSLILAHRLMRERNMDILAVYHSHPASDPIPSRKDLERNAHGSDVIHLIISLMNVTPLVRAWQLRENDYHEADWRMSEQPA